MRVSLHALRRYFYRWIRSVVQSINEQRNRVVHTVGLVVRRHTGAPDRLQQIVGLDIRADLLND